jgi:hypothetical protein
MIERGELGLRQTLAAVAGSRQCAPSQQIIFASVESKISSPRRGSVGRVAVVELRPTRSQPLLVKTAASESLISIAAPGAAVYDLP